jgi:hypothetical protein
LDQQLNNIVFLFAQLCFLSKQLWFPHRMSSLTINCLQIMKCSSNVTNVTYTCPSLNRHLIIDSLLDFYPSCHVTSWIAILNPKGSAKITESYQESAKELLLNKVNYGINDKFWIMFKLIWHLLIKMFFKCIQIEWSYYHWKGFNKIKKKHFLMVSTWFSIGLNRKSCKHVQIE